MVVIAIVVIHLGLVHYNDSNNSFRVCMFIHKAEPFEKKATCFKRRILRGPSLHFKM